MSPPLYRDWWLAATLTSTVALPTGVVHAANMPSPVGVVTAVAPHNTAAGDTHTLHVGSDIASGQRIRTHSNGPLHVLFVDQSAVTLGPDSELTINEFTYNPETRQGQIHLELTKGSLRIVGGHISKNNAAVITTPFATVKVEGGISLVSVAGGNTQATFLFGRQMQVRTPSGFQNIVRPGFSVNTNNGNLTTPFQLPPQQLTSQLGQLERPGAPPPPSAPPASSGPLVSVSDRSSPPNLPNRQLAPDRVQVNRDSTAQANPTLVLNTLLNSSSSTIQS